MTSQNLNPKNYETVPTLKDTTRALAQDLIPIFSLMETENTKKTLANNNYNYFQPIKIIYQEKKNPLHFTFKDNE